MNILNNIINPIKKTFIERQIYIQLIKHDFKQEYLGSYFGIGWAFFQPLFTTLILWFVFEKGFRSPPIQDFPFILWLICGLFPWQFLSTCISNGTNSIIANSYLVKKMVFRVSLLPIIKILSGLIIHTFFVGLIAVLFVSYGYFPNIYWLQIPYYVFCSFFLLLGIGWLTSSVVIFFKDISNIVGVFLQFGFWLTPIFWNAKILNLKLHLILKLNPLYYIIEGYRNSFVNQIWFWEHGYWTLYYWGFSIFIFMLGWYVFRKLRPHFADVI